MKSFRLGLRATQTIRPSSSLMQPGLGIFQPEFSITSQDLAADSVSLLFMGRVNRFERKKYPQLITVVRAQSTADQSVPEGHGRTELRRILADVQQVVRAMDESILRPVAASRSNPAFQPRVLLSLLVHCYVTGTYSSADIEEMLRRDVAFRRLCQGEFPSARLLKRFRRENRAAVRNCLCAVLRRQNQRHSPVSADVLDTPSRGHREDADRRLLKAMFIDSLEDEHD